jgi:hypothetical protein
VEKNFKNWKCCHKKGFWKPPVATWTGFQKLLQTGLKNQWTIVYLSSFRWTCINLEVFIGTIKNNFKYLGNYKLTNLNTYRKYWYFRLLCSLLKTNWFHSQPFIDRRDKISSPSSVFAKLVRTEMLMKERMLPNYGISLTCLDREEPTRSMSSL